MLEMKIYSNFPIWELILLKAALGKDIMCVIDGINEQSSDISKFCFEQVFSELSLEAKSILYALCLDNEAAPKGVLKYISNLDDISFEDCIHDLLIVSLILPEQKVNKQNGEINSYYIIIMKRLTNCHQRIMLF